MKRIIGIAFLSVSALALTSMATPARADCPTDVGAALAAACPCSGPANGGVWKNHGQHQKCVVHFRNDLRKHQCLTAASQRTIASCSARSTCGKPGAVLCCTITGTGTCDTQADLSLKCSNDTTVACTTAADCTTTSTPRVRRTATACTTRGGYVSGEGSVCEDCTPPVACCLTAGGCQVLTAADCSAVGTASTSPPSCDPSPCTP